MRVVTKSLIAAGVAALALLAAAAWSGAGANEADGAKAANGNCYWIGPFSVKRGQEYNNAFPDRAAAYWTARYTVPPGATLRLHGRFAHARYQSLNSYGSATKGAVDAINDVSTRPDRGSRNPFLPGAKRDVKNRKYTITVSPEPPPAEAAARAPNTLYAGGSSAEQELIYRIYVPDKGRDLTGGVGLPRHVLTLADGTVLRGDAACAVLGSEGNALETSRIPMETYLALRDQPGKPPTFPARNPPRFRAFYSTAYTIQCVYQDVCPLNPARTGGQYSNIDNQYVGTFLSRGFGKVLVLRGKLPRTPRTLHGEKRMGKGQLRYWSICQNESFATTAGAGCLYDEQVPVNRKRRYTIVTSRVGDRPRNATAKCGVGFIRWPRRGDGAGHPDDALLFIRNMLPAPSFHRAVQDTRVPGDEREVMGEYLPRARYMSKREFQKRGC